MCYRPIHIYNPSRRWNADQPLKIAVPCGRCADCRRVKRNEWYFRSVQEFQDYKSRGGAVYFVTLTYNNDNLPHLITPNGVSVPCFNRKHIRNFIKYLRTFLTRHGYISEGIKYLVCSEYGDKYKRPHYHALLFFPYHFNFYTDKVSINERYEVGFNGRRRYISPFEWLIRSVWKFGFIVCSKLGWEIQSNGGIYYTSKYICKDIAFENQSSLRPYLLDPYYKDWVNSIKDSLPNHWQSVGFGEKFCEIIDKQTDIPQFLANNRFSLCEGDSNSYPIPRYYHLKYEKKINKEYSKILDKVVLEPTEIGLKVKSIRLSQAVLKDEKNIAQFKGDSLSVLLPDSHSYNFAWETFQKCHPKTFSTCQRLLSCVSDNRFNSYDDFRRFVLDFLPSALDSVSIFNLSIYRIFLRYMPLYDDEVPEHKFAEVTDIISHMISTDVFPPEYENTIRVSGLDIFATPISDNPQLKKTPCCCYNPYFRHYENICLVLDMVNFVIGLNKENETFLDTSIKDNCRMLNGSKPNIYQSFN